MISKKTVKFIHILWNKQTETETKLGLFNKGVFFPQFWCCVGSNLVKLGHIRAKKPKIAVFGTLNQI